MMTTEIVLHFQESREVYQWPDVSLLDFDFQLHVFFSFFDAWIV